MSENMFNHLGVMIDNSRNAVMKPSVVKKMIDLLSEMGYNTLMLYTEDTYEVNNQPYFGHLRGRYSKAELKEIDSYAKEKGIELMPCIQTLAHLDRIMRWPQYSEMSDCGGILCVGDEKTYELIEDIFATLDECFTSRTVNIGMDEAESVGLGRYLKEHGYQNRSEILVNHLNRVSEIAKKYGFELQMWGDMFFKLAGDDMYNPNIEISDEIKKKIPDNVRLIYWDYYTVDEGWYDTLMKAYGRVKDDIVFAGGIWTWSGFTPQNTFSIRATKAAIGACKTNNIKDVIFTMWGDNGGETSRFAVLPGLFYASELAKGNTDEADIKQKFENRFGIPFDDFMLIDLPDSMRNIEWHTNPEKYLLYNDLFLGVVDGNIPENVSEGYKVCSEKLSRLTDNEEWGFLFKTQKALCDVLEIKADLGIRTRKAYLEKNTEELKGIISDYTLLEERLDIFYNIFEEQWMRENKPHGFDVQDIRLGGVARRTKHCKKILEKFINAEIDSIPELEEPVLDFKGRGTDLSDKSAMELPFWSSVCSVNALMW